MEPPAIQDFADGQHLHSWIGNATDFQISGLCHLLTEVAQFPVTRFLKQDQPRHWCAFALKNASQVAYGTDPDIRAAFHFKHHAFKLPAPHIEVQPSVNAAIRRSAGRDKPVHLFDRPFLEVILVALPKIAGTLDALGNAFNPEINAFRQAKPILKPDLCDTLDCVDGYVDTDPAPVKPVPCLDSSCTTAERVEHNIAFVGTGRYDALKKGQRLLCGIAKAFF